MQEVLDKLGARDPAVARVLVNNPQGIDAMLLQFPSYRGDPTQTKELQRELEELWAGDDDAITATSESIISITVTDSITERQTEAVATTIAAALTVLAVFFWVTLRQPALAIVAVGPIVLVLICVLGTMALLGIPYSLITSHHHGALDRDRRGLHHPCDSSLPGGVRPPAQPGGSGGADPRDHWVGAVGLCTDDRARAGSAGGLAVGCCPTPSGEPRPLSPLSAPLCPPSLLLASRLQQWLSIWFPGWSILLAKCSIASGDLSFYWYIYLGD